MTIPLPDAAIEAGQGAAHNGWGYYLEREAITAIYTAIIQALTDDQDVVERVARALAQQGNIDLSVAIHEAGGICAAVDEFESRAPADALDDPRWKSWRIPHARGVVAFARAALSSLTEMK